MEVMNQDSLVPIAKFKYEPTSKQLFLYNMEDSIIALRQIEYNDFLRWLSVDPMEKERTWVTPYNFVQNNPISRIDPTGALDGNYYKENNNGELEFVGSDGKDDGKAYVQNDYGNVEYGETSYYEVLGGQTAFNGDYNEGSKFIDNMALSKVEGYILSANGRRAEKNIDYAMKPKSINTIDNFNWIKSESVLGDIDFKYYIAGKEPDIKTKPATKTLYLAGDYYMNVNTFGNFVWGAYGAQLEISKSNMMNLAQAGSMIHFRFDEPHEQKAISLGHDYMNQTIKFKGNYLKYSYSK